MYKSLEIGVSIRRGYVFAMMGIYLQKNRYPILLEENYNLHVTRVTSYLILSTTYLILVQLIEVVVSTATCRNQLQLLVENYMLLVAVPPKITR